jgi:hypothetical protein
MRAREAVCMSGWPEHTLTHTHTRTHIRAPSPTATATDLVHCACPLSAPLPPGLTPLELDINAERAEGSSAPGSVVQKYLDELLTCVQLPDEEYGEDSEDVEGVALEPQALEE